MMIRKPLSCCGDREPASAVCPACGHRLTAAAMRHWLPTRPGDFGVCFGCGHITRCGDDLRVWSATPEQIAELARTDPAEHGRITRAAQWTIVNDPTAAAAGQA